MPRVLLSGSALMLGFGGLEVAIPAFADAAGSPGMSGVLLAVWSLGSVAGGLWFGARVVSVNLPRQYRWGLLGVTIGLAPLALVSSPWALSVLLFLGGTAIAPTLTVQSSLVGAIAPAHATTEAFTWLSTIAFGASAVGAAVGGALIEGPAGVNGSLLLAAAGAALAVAVTLLPGRRPSAVRTSRSPCRLTCAGDELVAIGADRHEFVAGRRRLRPPGRRLRAAGSLLPRWFRATRTPGGFA